MGFPETNLKKIPELPRTILTFAENYFKTFCLFRLQDDKLALVYQRLSNKAEKNGKYNIQKRLSVCKEHGLGYRVLIAHADDRLREAGEYLALNEFMEEKIPVGAVYECQNKDIIEYRKASYILGELKDINAHCDLEDERVKVYCQPVLNTRTNPVCLGGGTDAAGAAGNRNGISGSVHTDGRAARLYSYAQQNHLK